MLNNPFATGLQIFPIAPGVRECWRQTAWSTAKKRKYIPYQVPESGLRTADKITDAQLAGAATADGAKEASRSEKHQPDQQSCPRGPVQPLRTEPFIRGINWATDF